MVSGLDPYSLDKRLVPILSLRTLKYEKSGVGYFRPKPQKSLVAKLSFSRISNYLSLKSSLFRGYRFAITRTPCSAFGQAALAGPAPDIS